MTKLIKVSDSKEILGGKTQMKGDRKYDAKTIAKQLKKYKLPKKQKVVVENPVTNVSREITLVRTGTDEKRLMQVFKDPTATKKQKDAIIAAYLFENGKEDMSFLAELFISKGNHVRETHAFKKQMRFDYEMFADVFVRFLDDAAEDLTRPWTTAGKLDALAKRFAATSEMLAKRIQGLTEDRMREKGYGIYVNKNGEVFDSRDKEILGAVEKDVATEVEENERTRNPQ